MKLKQVIKCENAPAIEVTWVDENDIPVKCQTYSNAQTVELLEDLGEDKAEYVELIAEVAATYTPEEVVPPVRKAVIRDWEFRNRFNQEQLVGVLRAAMAGDNTAALVWLALSTASDGVDLKNKETIQGVQYIAATYPDLKIDPEVILKS